MVGWLTRRASSASPELSLQAAGLTNPKILAFPSSRCFLSLLIELHRSHAHFLDGWGQCHTV